MMLSWFAASRSLALLLCIFCLTSCSAFKPPATQSNSQQPPPSWSSASTFGDLLRSDAPPASDPAGARNAATTPRNQNGASNANGPAVYEGSSVSREPVVVGSSRQSAEQPAGGLIPAAFRVSESGGTRVEGDKYRVAFDNADIVFVARTILGELLNNNYTVDPAVHGTITLSAQRPLTRTQLLLLLETALRSQGAIMVNQDGTWRIVQATDATAVGGANIGSDAGAPGFGLTALPLENITADALSKIFDGFGRSKGIGTGRR